MSVHSHSAPRRSAVRVARIERLEHRQLLSAVTGFTLINSQTDQPVRTINNGDTINLATLPAGKLNVRADTDNQGIKSVRFRLDANSNFKVEGSAPYALFSDQGGDYKDGTFSVGSHTIKATPYSRGNAQGVAGTAKQITFNVVNQPTTPPPPVPAPEVTQFLLINADTDLAIEEINPGDTFNLATLPTRNLNVEVRTAGSTESVRIALNGAARIENTAPNAYFGNTGVDFLPGTLPVGANTLTAQAFTADNARGTAGALKSVGFTVIDQPVAQPAPEVTQFFLIDSQFGNVIREIKDGDVIDIDKPGEQVVGSLLIEVKTSGATGSVRTDLVADAAFPAHVDNAAPFNTKTATPLFPFSGGDYKLTAQAFAGADGTGPAGAEKTINFAFVRSPRAPFEQGDELTLKFNGERVVGTTQAFTVARDAVNVLEIRNDFNVPIDFEGTIPAFPPFNPNPTKFLRTLDQLPTSTGPLNYGGVTVLPLVPGPRLDSYLEYFNANSPEPGDNVANSSTNFTLLSSSEFPNAPDDARSYLPLIPPEPQPGNPFFLQPSEPKVLQPGEKLQLAIIGLVGGTTTAFEFEGTKFSVAVARAAAGEVTVMYDDPDDADEGVNDIVFQTDDLTTPELDVGFTFSLSFEDQIGAFEQFSVNNNFAIANTGGADLVLSGPLEVSINRLSLENSVGTRFLSLDRTREIGRPEYEANGGYEIHDASNRALKAEIIGFVQPAVNAPTNDGSKQFPITKYTFLQANDPLTPQADDLKDPLVLGARVFTDLPPDQVEFTLAQGDTPAQGGGTGKPAPSGTIVRPRGRR